MQPTPDLSTRLDAIEASLARVERALGGLASPAQQLAHEAPRLAATAADVFDDAVADIPDADARLRALLRLAMRVSRPETLDLLATSLDLAEQAPQVVAAAIDTVDALVAAAARAGVDIHGVVELAGRMGVQLVERAPALERLMASGLLDAATLDTLSALGRATAAESTAPSAPIEGLWASLKALRDPDVQRALGFAVGLARRFGAARRDLPALAAR